MESISGQCLLGACAAGPNEDAWREFLRRYGRGLEAGLRRGLRRLARRGSREELQDLLQDVYCRLLEEDGRRLRASRGSSDGEIGSYLRRLAENVVLDQGRAARARKRQAPVFLGADLDELTGDEANGAEERLLRRERALEVLRACQGPRRRPRTEFIARKALFEGWSSREIARALPGATPSLVDGVLTRVYRRLRERGFRPPRRATSRRRQRSPR